MREEIFPLQRLGQKLSDHDETAKFNNSPVPVNVDKNHGYLKPLDFLQEVERLLDDVKTSNTPCTLLVGKPSQGMVMSDIVTRHAKSSRLDEWITTDDNYCYLYLNADSKSAALENLKNILGLPVDEVFSQSRLLIGHDEINIELVALSEAVKGGALPDFSLIFDFPSPLNQASPSQMLGDRAAIRSREVLSSIQSVITETNELERRFENFLIPSFKSARRSSAPSARFFDRSEPADISVINIPIDNELVDGLVFDADLDTNDQMYVKKEASGAKRSLI